MMIFKHSLLLGGLGCVQRESTNSSYTGIALGSSLRGAADESVQHAAILLSLA
jgi:hypothetical protein